MESARPFSDAARAVMGSVLAPASLVRLLLAATGVTAAGALTPFVGGLGLPASLALPVATIVLAPALAAHALAARHGRPDRGLAAAVRAASGAELRLAARGFLLVGPVVAASGAVLDVLLAGSGPWAGTRLGGGLALAALAAAGFLVVVPVLLLLAVDAGSLGGLLSGAARRRLLAERGEDVPAYVGTAIGAPVLFALIAWPCCALVAAALAGLRPELAVAGAVSAAAAPAVVLPVTWGRLAGAFVRASGAAAPARIPQPRDAASAPRDRADSAAAADSDTMPGVARTRCARTNRGFLGPAARPTLVDELPRRGSVSIARALARAHERAATDCPGAVAEVQRMAATHRSNPAVLAALARLLAQDGRTDEARRAAGQAVGVAVAGGATPIAHDVLLAFPGEEGNLGLDASSLARLGDLLAERRDPAAAARCLVAAVAHGWDSALAQRRLLELAHQAERAGDVGAALAVLDLIHERMASGPLADLARRAAEELRGSREPAEV